MFRGFERDNAYYAKRASGHAVGKASNAAVWQTVSTIGGDRGYYWTVLALEPGRRLTLHFGMRAPGSGVLEFEIDPQADGRTRLTVTAYWHPQGVWGLLYWYAMVPAHLFIFRAMSRAMLRHAARGE